LPAKKSGLPADPIPASAVSAFALPEDAAADFLNRIRRPAHILVAISGGSDSTGLLVALADRLKTFSHPDITLSAATIDHGLRAESGAEAETVAALCSRLGIAHRTGRWVGEKPKSGIMAAAREARYGLLADIAAEISANVIVTAHTSDDQRETLAMRAARTVFEDGAGTGIADAVLFDRRIWIVRPFLGCRRSDIRDYLSRQSIGWIDDPSNEDPHYERVRIRKSLAEQTDGRIDGPDAREVERTALSAAAAGWLAAHVTVHGSALCEIRSEGLRADAKLLRYALSNLAAVFGGRAFPAGRDRMDRILDFLAAGIAGRRTAAGVVFDLRGGGLFLMRESRGIAPLTVAPGEAGVWDGRFEVTNRGRYSIRVEPKADVGADLFPKNLPKGAIRRARAALPEIRAIDGIPRGWAGSDVTVSPYFAPFDRFLTRFDLMFADRLAVSFGRTPYLCPPL
jgi:tRNA(Ile)-lysidine synthase